MNENQEKGKKEQEEEIPKGILPENIYELTKFFLSALASQVWVYLGLIYNPQTNKITQDLKQAKLGIDCFEFLFNKIRDELKVDETKQLTELLANLQLNFIEKSKLQ